jgi:hypothetical protein
VGVDLGRADAGVAEEFLDDAEVGAAGEQMGGEGVAEEMGIDAGIKPGGLGGFFHDPPEVGGGEAAAVVAEEHLAAGFGAD